MIPRSYIRGRLIASTGSSCTTFCSKRMFFLKGLAIGFSIAAPVGPIGLLCIRRSLADGLLIGLATGLGAATADAAYGCVAGFGLTAVSKQPGDLGLALWLPATRSIEDVRNSRLRVRTSARPGGRQYFSYRAPKAGTYFVQVRMSTPGSATYRLTIVKG